MASGSKRKNVFISIADKLKVIDRLEAGNSVRAVAEEFGIGLSTVKDLKKNKEKLRSYSLKFEADSNVAKIRKTMRAPPSDAVDEAVYKWYQQLHSSGVKVRGVDILAAAERFAKQLDIHKFSFNSGWLWRFRNRHGLPPLRPSSGESDNSSEVPEGMDPFLKKVREIMEQSGLSLSQLYNFDETGLFYRMLPENTLTFIHEDSKPESKLCKEKLSALLCSNASGSHRLKAVVVGRNKKSCALTESLHSPPLHYYHNTDGCFTRGIIRDWFFKHAEPEIRRFQVDELKVPPEDVCAIVIMDKALAHPDDQSLSSCDGRIRCLAIPSNLSLAQPMEQGIILTTKRLYRKKFLEEVLILPDVTVNQNFSRHTTRAVADIKNYSLKAALYNFADAWRDVPQATLVNSWKCLLNNCDVHWEMQGIEVLDFLKILTTAGANEVTEASVLTWLEEDEVDPGYQMLTDEQIVQEILQARSDNSQEDESVDEMVERKQLKLSTIRNHCDDILAYIDSSGDLALQDYYEHLRSFKKIVIQREYRQASQIHLHDFFRSPGDPSPPHAPETQPVIQDANSCS